MKIRLLGSLFPPGCLGCGVGVEPSTSPVCKACWHRLPVIRPPRCPRCSATRILDLGIEGCTACAGWPLGAIPVVAPFRMEGLAAELVRQLKYGGWMKLADRMGFALAEPVSRLLANRDDAASSGSGATQLALVPVPLSASRVRERGFNQAELLAERVGRELGQPVRSLLRRRASGRAQARLGRRARTVNVSRQFELTDRGALPTHVLLVDDVVTTGATAAACVAALKTGGLTVAGIACFARAWRDLEPTPGRRAGDGRRSASGKMGRRV